jgi:simple sugar transport system permease protein
MVDVLFDASMWEAAVRLATPVALAALAALLCYRAGILLVGVEGVVLIGAFFSVAATIWAGSPWVGALAGMAAGCASSLLLGFMSMHLRMGDVIAGVVYHFGSIGVTGFLVVQWFDDSPAIGSDRISPLWGDPGFLGPILHQDPLVYIALIATVALWWMLRTAPGLRLRACGEAPASARTLGVSVRRLRYGVYAVAGVLAGLAGVFLGLVFAGTFDTDVVDGRGYVGLACVLLGAMVPVRVLAAAFFFGIVDAYRYQAPLGDLRDWFQMLPFVLTIIAVAWVGHKNVVQATEEDEVAAAQS